MSPAPVILGTAQLGMRYGLAATAPPSTARAESILAAAREAGIRLLDTAPAYGMAESRIGRFLRRHPGAFEVGTKLPPGVAGGAGAAKAVEDSLRRLGVERLAYVLFHRMEDLRRGGESLLEPLRSMQAAGTIGKLGLSVYGPELLDLLDTHTGLELIQHPLNLIDRRLIPALPDLRSRGVAVHARSPLLQGLLALDSIPPRMARAQPTLDRLRRALPDYRRLALPFAACSGVDGVVLGVDGPEQLQAQLRNLDHPLPPDLDALLDRAIPDPPQELIDPSRWPAGAGA